jgi:hypothetical protein
MTFKAKTMSKTRGNLDSRKLINEGQCTIVAEFLRRVQEVIWNRQLMTTKNADKDGKRGKGRLGLVRDDVKPGFKVCILYGCSVPVILEEINKTPTELNLERWDTYLHWKKEVHRIVALCQARFRMKQLRKERKKEREQKEAAASSGNLPKLPPLQEAWFNDPTRSLKQPKPSTANETSTKDVAPLAGADISRRQSGIPLPGATVSEIGDPSKQPPSRPPPPPPSDRKVNDFSSEPQTTSQSRKEKEKEPLEVEQTKFMRRRTALEHQQERAQGEKEFLEHKAKIKEKINNEVKPGSYFHIVGECYVHGMMNGEAIGLQNQKGIQEQTFELR